MSAAGPGRPAPTTNSGNLQCLLEPRSMAKTPESKCSGEKKTHLAFSSTRGPRKGNKCSKLQGLLEKPEKNPTSGMCSVAGLLCDSQGDMWSRGLSCVLSGAWLWGLSPEVMALSSLALGFPLVKSKAFRLGYMEFMAATIFSVLTLTVGEFQW
jgi:hypothetical protein